MPLFRKMKPYHMKKGVVGSAVREMEEVEKEGDEILTTEANFFPADRNGF